MTSMRRVAAHRLESMGSAKLLGSREIPGVGVEQAAPNAAEAIQAQQSVFDIAREQGCAEGMRDAEAKVKLQVEAIATRLREEHAAALKRLHAEHEHVRKIAASLSEALAVHAVDSETLAVEVAFAAITRLLADKSADGTLMRELCQRIVHEYGHPPATLRVSEADLPLLEAEELGIPVEADRRLAPGQCVIDTARGQFESGLDVRLDALRTTLLDTLSLHRNQA